MITLGPVTFDDTAFADGAALVSGAPPDDNLDGLIGASKQTVANIGASNLSPTIEVRFTDNVIVNGPGVDAFVYVPGEVFAVAVSWTPDFATGTTAQASVVDPASITYFDSGNPFAFNPNSILLAVDLSNLGLADGVELSSLFLQRVDIEGAIYGVGAVNSRPVDPSAGSEDGGTIRGTDAAEPITGTGGGDILIGLGGGDLVTGGGGDDFFAFLVTDAAGPARIRDFDEGDRLALDDRFFGLGDDAVDVRAVTADQITNALRSGAVIYDGQTGLLSIDGDGRGGPLEATAIAILEGGGPLGTDDVILF